MLIDLYGILSCDGEVKKLTAPIEAESFCCRLGDFPYAEKQEVSLVFTNAGGKLITADSVVDVTLNIPCDRCLTNVPVRIKVVSSRKLNFKEAMPKEEEPLRDMPFIDGTIFDAEKYVYSEILENFPTKVLCKTDCKGICCVCGMNLNLGSCNCDRQALDPRMSKIRDIFQQFNQ